MTTSWKNPLLTKFSDWAKIFGCGICMGAADIVPGISGGTVAFIIGIYEDLLNSISTFDTVACKLLFTGQIRALFKKISWRFLLALLLGVAFSFVTLAKYFTFLLNHELYRTYLYSAFMGLVIGSLFFCYKQLSAWSVKSFCSFFLGALIAYSLSGADLMQKNHEVLYDVPVRHELFAHDTRVQLHEKKPVNYDMASHTLKGVPASQLSGMVAKGFLSEESVIECHGQKMVLSSVWHHATPPLVDFFVMGCGVMAICAMLLPGISGSYLLTVLGMYGTILGALVDWLHGLQHATFDWNAFRILFSMVCGIVIGATLFSRVVSYLLAQFREMTLAALVGFMVGALRAVWPFWSYQYELLPLRLDSGPILQVVQPVMPPVASVELLIAALFLVVGIGTVIAVETIAGVSNAKARGEAA